MLSEKQLVDRINSIGGSEASIILGYNKYKSKVELFLEKTGQKEIEQIDELENIPVLWGNLSEDNVAKVFERFTGKKVRKSNKKWVHSIYDYITGNLDRVIVGEKAFLECKTANGWKAKEWEDEDIPIEYRLQCLHYLAVTGFERGYIAVMIDNTKFVWKVVERDEELIEMIIQEEVAFWNDHVLAGVIPAFDGSEASTNLLNELYSRAKGDQVYLPSEAEIIIEKWEEAKEYEKTWKETKAKYENQLKEALKDAETGLTENHVVSWKNVDINRFDSKRFKVDHPALYEEYINTTSSRRFGVK